MLEIPLEIDGKVVEILQAQRVSRAFAMLGAQIDGQLRRGGTEIWLCPEARKEIKEKRRLKKT